MKIFKLNVHQKMFSGKSRPLKAESKKFATKPPTKIMRFVSTEDEVILNSNDYPALNVGDVIEVYSPNDEFR